MNNLNQPPTNNVLNFRHRLGTSPEDVEPSDDDLDLDELGGSIRVDPDDIQGREQLDAAVFRHPSSKLRSVPKPEA
jgi:hypothetical protein